MPVIDKTSRKPIYEQIVEGIEREILTGILAECEQLPSIRELSALLGINPNTIQKAFLDLDRAGIIISTPGRGCFVAPHAKEKIRERLSSKIADIQAIASELSNAGVEESAVIEAVKAAYGKRVGGEE